jgi:hypothetical protein
LASEDCGHFCAQKKDNATFSPPGHHKDGVIRAKLFLDGYRERHSVNELLKAVEAIKNPSEDR